MARWITGLTVERRRVIVRAASNLSAPECVTDPADCCTDTDLTGGVGGPTCCPDEDLAATVAVASSGPLGTDGATCAVDFDITRDAELDPHKWNGEGVGTGGDCDDVRVLVKIWFAVNDLGFCEWFVSGDTFDQGGVRRTFGPVLMDDDGATLTAEAFLPGLEDTLSFAIERPCTMATEAVFTVPGTYEWAVPAGVVEVTVEAWASGGAGGSTAGNPDLVGWGGGGGGAYSRSVWTVTPAETVTVIVGEGGLVANWPSSSGQDSSAVAGAQSVVAKGGASGTVLSAGGGGNGGAAAGGTGDVKYDGGAGGDPTDDAGGGGGGSGGTAVGGNPGTAASGGPTAGTGAAAVTGGGGGGDGALTNASAGTAPGGGGGGAGPPSGGDKTGGDGASGQVRITWA